MPVFPAYNLEAKGKSKPSYTEDTQELLAPLSVIVLHLQLSFIALS